MILETTPTITTTGYHIYHNFTIAATAEEVFNAITLPKHLIQWWPLQCNGVPKKNEVYNFFFSPEYNWYGKVLHLEKNKAFYIQMTAADTDWTPTSFGFDLHPKNDKVHIEFWHKNWQECNAHFKTSSFCWALLLKGLKDYLEKGVVIPYKERA